MQAGERVLAVERLQGLKKGEKQKAICEIEIVSVRQEPLFRIADWDFKHPVSGIVSNNECYREGFPEMLGPDFVDMFCRHMKCQPNQWVFRIEFKYV